jgi:GTP-binding protein
VPEAEREALVRDFVRRFRWKGPVFQISALARTGLDPLVHAVYDHVAAAQRQAVESDPRFPSGDELHG